MKLIQACRAFIIVYLLSLAQYGFAGELSGHVDTEFWYYPQDPFDPRQHDYNISLSIETEFYQDWDNGRQVFAFVPFFRLDKNDSQRTHFDIRELTWEKAAAEWELRLGVRKVFWGVIEFQHLVDIINQTDLVENIDGEDKLGQPMVNLALVKDWGTVDLLVMPWFRERTFPGSQGRPRTSPPVAEDLARYESGAREKHVDLAIRYAHSIGDWDIGLAHFYGTSRDPRLLFEQNQAENQVLIPLYEIINQTSLDIQATKGNMLWKLEALHRSGQGETYNAVAAGFEYTFTGIMETSIDLGLLGEYFYDERGSAAPTILQDDMGLGIRLAFNDAQSSEALIGLIWDKDTQGKLFNLEARRRIGDSWVMEAQARLFLDQSPKDLSYVYSRDDYIQLLLSYNF